MQSEKAINSEPIEDYCIRAGRVYPWALQAGYKIKALKFKAKRLNKEWQDKTGCYSPVVAENMIRGMRKQKEADDGH